MSACFTRTETVWRASFGVACSRHVSSCLKADDTRQPCSRVYFGDPARDLLFIRPDYARDTVQVVIPKTTHPFSVFIIFSRWPEPNLTGVVVHSIHIFQCLRPSHLRRPLDRLCTPRFFHVKPPC